MSQKRLQAAFERLISNGPAIVEGLRQAGYQNLALQTQHDIEALAWARGKEIWTFEEPPEEERIGHPDEWNGEDVPEPPPDFVEEHWETDTVPDKPFRHSWGWETFGHLV